MSQNATHPGACCFNHAVSLGRARGHGLASATTVPRQISAAYRPRRPEESVLRQVLREHLPAFKARIEQADRSLPVFVEKELEAILACGDPRRGVTRWICDRCGHEQVLPFSCKCRLDPSCASRRMTAGAAFLVDYVIPEVPVRHWTLTYPPPLRFYLAFDADLFTDAVRIAVHTIFDWQRRIAKDLLGLKSKYQAHCGAITAIHRARSDLRINVHPHNLVLDGVFVEDAPGRAPRFHALPAPSAADIQQVAWEICQKTTRLCQKRGVYLGVDADEADSLATEEPLLTELATASMLGTVALGERAGQQLLQLGIAVDDDHNNTRRDNTPAHGFNLHAGLRIPAHDRRRLEKLCRYVLRPPIAEERLSFTKDGNVLYRLRRPWKSGTTAVSFSPLDFIAKIVPLVARPHVNLVKYFGVLAARSKLRHQVIPDAPFEEPFAPQQLRLFPKPSRHGQSRKDEPADENASPRRKRYTRAQLLARTFAEDFALCPRCGHQPLRLVAVITDPQTLSRLLASVGWRAEPRALPNPACGPRAPPQLDLPFASRPDSGAARPAA